MCSQSVQSTSTVRWLFSAGKVYTQVYICVGEGGGGDEARMPTPFVWQPLWLEPRFPFLAKINCHLCRVAHCSIESWGVLSLTPWELYMAIYLYPLFSADNNRNLPRLCTWALINLPDCFIIIIKATMGIPSLPG